MRCREVWYMAINIYEEILLSYIWKQQLAPKTWFLSTRLQTVTSSCHAVTGNKICHLHHISLPLNPYRGHEEIYHLECNADQSGAEITRLHGVTSHVTVSTSDPVNRN
jgi:hypothetical protein